ncbi:MAG: DUF1997 domain-containing protein [Chitinophagaceae bacterium]|nr:DUF1997 domain-containing protein [Chitinophagaceae bacterium]
MTLSSPPLSSSDPEQVAADAAATPLLRHSDDSRVRRYASQFADLMEMRAPAELVAAYLDRHEGWFRRCAAPMTVEPLGSNGYRLTLGRFGNFGFEVEPTIGLELLPQSEGIYRILTVPCGMEGSALAGLYDVEFNASLELDEETAETRNDAIAPETTKVRWQLDLSVWIRLPAVITLLPDNLVQSSGEHLLRQIVRQISRRLTWKVQEDFHASHGLACPPRRRAQF